MSVGNDVFIKGKIRWLPKIEARVPWAEKILFMHWIRLLHVLFAHHVVLVLLHMIP